jgi:hypothetical protein
LAIWTARRKAIHECIFQSPLSTHGFVNIFLAEIQSLAKPERVSIRNLEVRPQAKWLPPPIAIPKINIDASVSKSGEKRVAAAICRDNLGVNLGASAIVYCGITDPSILESLACREALALAVDLGLSRFLVASDCKQVVSYIADGTLCKYGAVVAEIKAQARQFSECKFVFEGRVSNFEAHGLARHALCFDSGCHVWLGAPYAANIPVNIILN